MQLANFIILNHFFFAIWSWRAIVAPPRLPAFCMGFHAGALQAERRAITGAPGRFRSFFDHADPCSIDMHTSGVSKLLFICQRYKKSRRSLCPVIPH